MNPESFKEKLDNILLNASDKELIDASNSMDCKCISVNDIVSKLQETAFEIVSNLYYKGEINFVEWDNLVIKILETYNENKLKNIILKLN